MRSGKFQASVASYIESYNTQRPHRTLKNLTPCQVEENSIEKVEWDIRVRTAWFFRFLCQIEAVWVFVSHIYLAQHFQKTLLCQGFQSIKQPHQIRKSHRLVRIEWGRSFWQAAPIKISAVFLVFSMVSAFFGKFFGACCFILLVATVQPKKILWVFWKLVRSARFCQRSPLWWLSCFARFRS